MPQSERIVEEECVVNRGSTQRQRRQVEPGRRSSTQIPLVPLTLWILGFQVIQGGVKLKSLYYISKCTVLWRGLFSCLNMSLSYNNYIKQPQLTRNLSQRLHKRSFGGQRFMQTAHNLRHFPTCEKGAKLLLNGFNMSACTMYWR